MPGMRWRKAFFRMARGMLENRQCQPSKWHPREGSRSSDIVALAARRGILEFLYMNVNSMLLPEICRQSLGPPPRFVPREPPCQAMAISRGSSRGRVPRPRGVYTCSIVHSHDMSHILIAPWASRLMSQRPQHHTNHCTFKASYGPFFCSPKRDEEFHPALLPLPKIAAVAWKACNLPDVYPVAALITIRQQFMAQIKIFRSNDRPSFSYGSNPPWRGRRLPRVPTYNNASGRVVHGTGCSRLRYTWRFFAG